MSSSDWRNGSGDWLDPRTPSPPPVRVSRGDFDSIRMMTDEIERLLAVLPKDRVAARIAQANDAIRVMLDRAEQQALH